VISRRRLLQGCWPLAGVAGVHSAEAAEQVTETTNFAQASAMIQRAIARGDIPGAVLHVRVRDRVLSERAFGRKRIDRDLALMVDDIFPVASLTKPVVAAAAVGLSESGGLDLDHPISGYLAEFRDPQVLLSYDRTTGAMTTRRARRAIVVRDLLTHTAGIHHGFPDIDDVLGTIYQAAGVDHSARVPLAENVKRIGPLPLAHDPGARWTYGMSSDVLGRIIEVVTGVPLERHLSRAIFEPLAMRRTSFFVPPAERDKILSWHSTTTGGLRVMPRAAADGDLRYASGGGGLYTTIGDYARFGQMLLDGGRPILTRASVTAMTTNQIGNLEALGFRWGFSLAVSTPSARGRTVLPVGGFGWYGIFGTWFWVLPQRHAVILLFTNVLREDMTLSLFARVVADVEREIALTQ
jgi:CubicO group peptidase (beta-lactamase class C family)